MEAEARAKHRPKNLPATHVHRNSSQRCFRGGRFSVPSSSTPPAARFEGQKQQEVFKSYSIRSEVWRLWRPKKPDSPPPRGCPEPSRLEGHVTAVSLIKICFRIVAAGWNICKKPQAVGEGVLDRRLLWCIGRESSLLFKRTNPASSPNT